MTTTTIINGVSSGVTGNDSFNPVKTALQAATTALLCELSAVMTVVPNTATKLVLRQAWSPTSYADATAGMQALRQAAQPTELLLGPNSRGGATAAVITNVVVAGAGYHYCWLEVPTLGTLVTITVKLTELP